MKDLLGRDKKIVLIIFTFNFVETDSILGRERGATSIVVAGFGGYDGDCWQRELARERHGGCRWGGVTGGRRWGWCPWLTGGGKPERLQWSVFVFVGLQWSVFGSNWFWDLVCPFKFQTKNILSGPHIFNPSQLHLIEVCNWCAILGYP